MRETVSEMLNRLRFRDDKTDRLLAGFLEALGAVEVTAELRPPQRCRAIILDDEGESLMAVRRTRPGIENYAVVPGGGVEETDASPVATIRRELLEELGIEEDEVDLVTDAVVEFGGQWWFVGRAKPGLVLGPMGGPEAERDTAVSGTYEPTWIPLTDLDTENVVPAPIREKLVATYLKQLETSD